MAIVDARYALRPGWGIGRLVVEVAGEGDVEELLESTS